VTTALSVRSLAQSCALGGLSTRFAPSAQGTVALRIERVNAMPNAAALFESAATSPPSSFTTVYDASRIPGADEAGAFLAAKNAYVEPAGRGPRFDELIRALEDVLSKENP
jgi:hypothetical protein